MLTQIKGILFIVVAICCCLYIYKLAKKNN